MADDSQRSSFTGLGTYTYVTPTAGPYDVQWQFDLPQQAKGATANSAVVVTINLNGSPVYTGVAGGQGGECTVLCAAGDTITCVTTSAASVDAPLNVIKGNICISHGVY